MIPNSEVCSFCHSLSLRWSSSHAVCGRPGDCIVFSPTLVSHILTLGSFPLTTASNARPPRHNRDKGHSRLPGRIGVASRSGLRAAPRAVDIIVAPRSCTPRSSAPAPQASPPRIHHGPAARRANAWSSEHEPGHKCCAQPGSGATGSVPATGLAPLRLQSCVFNWRGGSGECHARVR